MTTPVRPEKKKHLPGNPFAPAQADTAPEVPQGASRHLPGNPFAPKAPAGPADFSQVVSGASSTAPVSATPAQKELARAVFEPVAPIEAPTMPLSHEVAARAQMGGRQTVRSVEHMPSTLPALPRGLLRGRGQVHAMAGQTLQMAGELLDADALARAGRSLEATGEAGQQRYQAEVPTIGDIESGPDALKFAGDAIGSGGATMVPAILGAMAAGPLGAFLASYGLSAGEARGELEQVEQARREEGRDAEAVASRKNALAAFLGLPIAALDMITPGRIAERITKRAMAEGVEHAAAEELADRILRMVLKDAATEGATEAAQEAIIFEGARTPVREPFTIGQSLMRMGEAGVAGALAGGAAGGGSAMASRGPREEVASPAPVPRETPAGPVAPAAPRPRFNAFGHAVIATPSTREPGRTQLTILDQQQQPIGHLTADTPEAADALAHERGYRLEAAPAEGALDEAVLEEISDLEDARANGDEPLTAAQEARLQALYAEAEGGGLKPKAAPAPAPALERPAREDDVSAVDDHRYESNYRTMGVEGRSEVYLNRKVEGVDTRKSWAELSDEERDIWREDQDEYLRESVRAWDNATLETEFWGYRKTGNPRAVQIIQEELDRREAIEDAEMDAELAEHGMAPPAPAALNVPRDTEPAEAAEDAAEDRPRREESEENRAFAEAMRAGNAADRRLIELLEKPNPTDADREEMERLGEESSYGGNALATSPTLEAMYAAPRRYPADSRAHQEYEFEGDEDRDHHARLTFRQHMEDLGRQYQLWLRNRDAAAATKTAKKKQKLETDAQYDRDHYETILRAVAEDFGPEAAAELDQALRAAVSPPADFDGPVTAEPKGADALTIDNAATSPAAPLPAPKVTFKKARLIPRRDGGWDTVEVEEEGRAEPTPPAPERIVGSTIRVGEHVVDAPTHGQAMEAASLEPWWPEGAKDWSDPRIEHGFRTSTGRIVSRAEAAELATTAEQTRPGYVSPGGKLDSADLAPTGPEQVDVDATLEEQAEALSTGRAPTGPKAKKAAKPKKRKLAQWELDQIAEYDAANAKRDRLIALVKKQRTERLSDDEGAELDQMVKALSHHPLVRRYDGEAPDPTIEGPPMPGPEAENVRSGFVLSRYDYLPRARVREDITALEERVKDPAVSDLEAMVALQALDEAHHSLLRRDDTPYGAEDRDHDRWLNGLQHHFEDSLRLLDLVASGWREIEAAQGEGKRFKKIGNEGPRYQVEAYGLDFTMRSIERLEEKFGKVVADRVRRRFEQVVGLSPDGLLLAYDRYFPGVAGRIAARRADLEERMKGAGRPRANAAEEEAPAPAPAAPAEKGFQAPERRRHFAAGRSRGSHAIIETREDGTTEPWALVGSKQQAMAEADRLNQRLADGLPVAGSASEQAVAEANGDEATMEAEDRERANGPEIDPDSPFAEDDPVALLEASTEQAREHYESARALQEALDAPRKKPLTPKQIEGMEEDIANSTTLYEGTLSEIAQAFGTAEMDRVRAQIEGTLASGGPDGTVEAGVVAPEGGANAEVRGAVSPESRGSEPGPVPEDGAGGDARDGSDGARGAGGPAVRGPARAPAAPESGTAGQSRPGAAPSGAREPGRGAGDSRAARGDFPERGHNYRISVADRIGQGSRTEKLRDNLTALETLQAVEARGTPATPAEQAQLVRYVGWGMFPGAFDPAHKEYQPRLKELLTDQEYESARASTLNAHYTSPGIIRAIHKALLRFGFENAKAIEPSMGVGHFLGLTPAASLEGTTPYIRHWTGIELDTVTGRIARLLYPESDVRVQGFEAFQAADGTYDLAVSNVPFGDFKLSDPRYDKLNLSIHNYFFAKALDLVRPGGIVAFVTSRYTLDSTKAAKFRAYVAERAEFIGAVRLPEKAFAGNAGTDVVTDVIFLQKKGPGVAATGLEFVKLATTPAKGGAEVPVNRYYVEHPEMVLGTLELARGMYRADEPTWTVAPGTNISELLERALERLPAGIVSARPVASEGTEQEAEVMIAPADVREGSFTLVDGKIKRREMGTLVDAQVPATQRAKVEQLMALRDGYRATLEAQLADASDAEITRRRTHLEKLYDRFVKEHGPIGKEVRTETARKDKKGDPIVTTRYPNLAPFMSDPEWVLVASLERYDPDTDKAEKADILTKRILRGTQVVDRADTPADALPLVLAERGKVDLPRIAEMAGVTEEEAAAQLADVIWPMPDGAWVTADQFLSGNVRAKLADMRRAAKKDARWQKHVDALEAVQPEDLKPSQISVRLGSAWLPTDDVQQFIQDVFGGDYNEVHHAGVAGLWSISPDWRARNSAANTTAYGTSRMEGLDILKALLNGQPIQVSDRQMDGSYVKNEGATLDAQAKADELKERFEKWVWEDAERAGRLARLYNDTFNNTRRRVYDGSHLTLPGAASSIKGRPFALRPHQRNAIWRILQERATLLAHVVGSGKTFTMVGAAMEAKRLGLARKPMLVVPNHMLAQFSAEFVQMYPNAKILVATREDFAKERRRAFTAKIASNDWDAIIMTHRSFEAVGMSAEAQETYLREQMDELVAAIYEQKAAKGHDRSIIKILENAKKKLEQRIEKLRAEKKKDDLLPFEALGVDMLEVDEAHMFKNLNIVSKQQGLGFEGSQRAFDLFLKTRYLHQSGGKIVFATGTPIANSVSEMFTVQRFLQPEALRAAGLTHFDSWSQTFGRMITALELAPDGLTYRMKTRFAAFTNVPELFQMFHQVADVQLAEDLDLPTPPVLGGTAEVVAVPGTPELKAYVQTLAARAEQLKGKRAEAGQDNMLKVTTDGRHAALDMRLVDGSSEDHAETKAQVVADRVFQYWEETADVRGTQLIFSDLSAPGSDPSLVRGGLEGFNIYDELKKQLIERGIPAREIAFMHDATNDDKKGKLFKDVRAGRVRVLIGSTEKMGAGTNVQDLLVAEHHMDPPWRPSDVEQRDGRIVRQGNRLYETGRLPGVRVIRYVTQGSFDAYMWQGLERKDAFIRQVMKGDPTVREIEDVDGSALNAAEVKALASGNPLIMEKAGVDAEAAKLTRAARAYRDQVFAAEQELLNLPRMQEALERRAAAIEQDRARIEPTEGDAFRLTINGQTLTKRAEAGQALQQALTLFLADAEAAARTRTEMQARRLGTFAGFELWLHPDLLKGGLGAKMALQGEISYTRDVHKVDSPMSLVSGLERVPDKLEGMRTDALAQEATLKKREADLKRIITEPFAKQAELERVLARQRELNAILSPKEGTGGVVRRLLEDEAGAGPNPFLKLVEKVEATRQGQRPLVASRLEEVEARIQAAHGLPTPSLAAKLRAALEELKQSLHHFPAFEGNDSPLAARMEELLLEVEHGPKWGRVMAAGAINDVVHGLSRAEVDVVSRALFLPDILKDVEAGLYDVKDLPFGYPDAEAVRADLADVERIVGSTPKLASALEARKKFNQALSRRLVALDQLPESVLKDDRYYHRIVLEYYEMQRAAAPGAVREVRNKTKGFQRKRSGGGDFNTAFHEAEFEYISQAFQVIQITEALAEVKAQADIQSQLKAEAKTLNQAAFKEAYDAAHGTDATEEVLAGFSKRIAIAKGELLRLLEAGTLELPPTFAHFEADYVAARAAYRAIPRAKPGEGKKPPFQFAHRDYWRLLTFLASREGPGHVQALAVFKAIGEREQLVKTTLGPRYTTWEDLVPDGYRIWQPERGMQMARGLTIGERTVDEILAGTAELQRTDVQQALVAAGMKPQWVIPDWLATTLDHLGRDPEISAIERAWTRTIGGWKVWQLLNPARALRYNLNNLSGDLDASLLYPGITRHIRQAARDLWVWMGKEGAKGSRRTELDRLARMRVLDQGLTVAEIPDLTTLPQFEALARKNSLAFVRWVGLYWDHARHLTQLRENMLRLAAYRYFLGELKAGRTGLYAASDRAVIQALPTAEQKAARLARDLLGDYGRISHGGTWLRERLIPFYSWLEINAKRYLNVARNIPHEAEGPKGQVVAGARLAAAAGANVGVRVGVQAVRVTILANLFFAAATAWNHLLWPDEEEELRERGRELHIILGRRADGTIRTVRLEGAFADFLSWFALQDYPADFRDLREGTASLLDKVEEGVLAPVARVISAWEPISKLTFELLTRRTTFPDPFQARPIRERADHLARSVSLGWLYRRVTGKPEPPGGAIEQFLTYSTDPGEAAYWHVRDLAYQFKEKYTGESSDGGAPTDRSNALYYWKKAEQWGQPEAAARWLERYYALGGTPRSAVDAIKRAAPLSVLPQYMQAAFVSTLEPKEKDILKRATAWYRDVYLRPAGARLRSVRPARPVPAGTPR